MSKEKAKQKMAVAGCLALGAGVAAVYKYAHGTVDSGLSKILPESLEKSWVKWGASHLITGAFLIGSAVFLGSKLLDAAGGVDASQGAAAVGNLTPKLLSSPTAFPTLAKNIIAVGNDLKVAAKYNQGGGVEMLRTAIYKEGGNPGIVKLIEENASEFESNVIGVALEYLFGN